MMAENKLETEKMPHEAISLAKDESDEKSSSRLMDLLKENLSCEMYHALLEVYNSKHYIIKIHLFIFLLISYGLASYTTIELIMSYFSYGVTTSIRTIYETPAIFPKVTLCNINMFTTKFAFEFLNSINNGSILDSLLRLEYYEMSQSYQTNLTLIGAILESKSNDFKMKLSHNLKDILIGCKFNYIKCTADDFIWSWNPYYGNCFSFNSGFNSTPLRYSGIDGYNYGLELDFYVNSYEELSFYNSILGGQGAMVFIDNVTHLVDRVYDGVILSAGMTTNVALKREFKSSMPRPYSDSLIDQGLASEYDSYLYNLIRNSPYDYTQKFCFQQCLQQLIIEKCKCRYYIFPSLTKADVCSTTSQLSCFVQTYLNIYGRNSYPEKVCLPLCLLECNSNQITFTTTSHELLGDVYEKFIRNNRNLSSDFLNTSITKETVKKSVARMYVYYDSLSYTESDEAPQIDIISLIANVGGNLGLFLGLSLFSVWEIFITKLEIYFYKKQRNSIQIEP